MNPDSYSLYNLSLYNPNIQNTYNQIIDKIINIVMQYMKFIYDKITIKNKKHYQFVVERGLETIMHVFLMIFIYTKNIDIAVYHTQKAYYFYIEYIEQISDDAILFLKLSSRDAIVFVYKKTIFDIINNIQHDLCKTTLKEEAILNNVNNFVKVYKHIIHLIIYNPNFNYDDRVKYIEECFDILKSINALINTNTIKTTHYISYLKHINDFTNILNISKHGDLKYPSINLYLNYLEQFIRQLQNMYSSSLKKKVLEEKHLTNQLIKYKINIMQNHDHLPINEENILKIINQLFTI
jgi:hypothetical protein